jgi:DNA repair exonuclease SbcCD ATPase subunit
METLTDLKKKLLEVRQIHSQLDKKKAVLVETKRELDKQMKELLQKQSELEKLMARTRQKELQLQSQIKLNMAEVQPDVPEVDYFPGAASKNLQNELLALLSGNGHVATRLLKHQQKLNPGRSLDWYLEKVIYDLKRDRH